MANQGKSITVPSTEGQSGASRDVSELKADSRTFLYTGPAGSIVDLEASNDGTNWCVVHSFGLTKETIVLNNRALFYRATRRQGAGAASLTCAGGEEATVPGPQGPAGFGGSALEGSTETNDDEPKTIATYTPGFDGGFSFLGSITSVRTSNNAPQTMPWILTARRVAGTVTLVGSLTSLSFSLWGECAFTATVEGGVIKWKVTGVDEATFKHQFNATVTAIRGA